MTTEPTVATEASFNIDSIKEVMDAFDPATLLPELDGIFSKVAVICRVAVLVGPILLVALGLMYLLLTPKEANHYIGYRCYFGMGSTQAWRFTQRFAGIGFVALGAVLSVIMFLRSGSFATMAVDSMVWYAARCLLWEAGLALVLNIVINIAAAMVFTAKGDYRRKK